MASSIRSPSTHDALYGELRFERPFASLLEAPIVQRMRHIRLSNIDSIDLPSIANISRYEHVLGVAHLGTLVGFRPNLNELDRLALDAAAVLHDWAITSFGHLVEEAFQFAGSSFEHEKHLSALASGELSSDILGLSHRQILAGREMGLKPWAEKCTGSVDEAEQLLAKIADYIQGRGRYGRVIAGTIDIDNIDNVTRMAYHLGLVRSGDGAIRLAKAIVDVDPESKAPVFSEDAVSDIRAWLRTRRDVYNLLMLSERDFAGKVMLLAATVSAFEAGEITSHDWAMTDIEFYSRLRASKVLAVRDVADRWYAGELWDMGPLSWFDGDRPSYRNLKEFSDEVSRELGRTFFVYGIKDKRDRRLLLNVQGAGPVAFGEDSRQWLLGFGSPKKQAVTKRESEHIWALVTERFGARRVGGVASVEESSEPAWLI